MRYNIEIQTRIILKETGTESNLHFDVQADVAGDTLVIGANSERLMTPEDMELAIKHLILKAETPVNPDYVHPQSHVPTEVEPVPGQGPVYDG